MQGNGMLCSAVGGLSSRAVALQGQLATYKEMAAAAEADRSRLEQEVLATAQLATSLEARLRTALAARDGAEARIAAAEMKAYEVRRLPCQVMCPSNLVVLMFQAKGWEYVTLWDCAHVSVGKSKIQTGEPLTWRSCAG